MVLVWKTTKTFVRASLWETRTSRPNVVKEDINADVCGPVTGTLVGGAQYYLCFNDTYFTNSRCFFITTKS